MKLLQELTTISENASYSDMMDTICNITKTTKYVGIPYASAVSAIAAEFRKLDQHDSPKMSDEALKDMIMGVYDEDEHLSQSNEVTNYRDVHFPANGRGPGAKSTSARDVVKSGNPIPKVKDVTNEDNEGGPTGPSAAAKPVAPVAAPKGGERTVATRTIAKTQNFRVDLGQNEQVSIIDMKGHIRLSMPYVEWQQLVRQ